MRSIRETEATYDAMQQSFIVCEDNPEGDAEKVTLIKG